MKDMEIRRAMRQPSMRDRIGTRRLLRSIPDTPSPAMLGKFADEMRECELHPALARRRADIKHEEMWRQAIALSLEQVT